MTEDLMTPAHLAQRWNVSTETLRRWRVAGTGPAFRRLGNPRTGPIRYARSAVEQYERECEVTS